MVWRTLLLPLSTEVFGQNHSAPSPGYLVKSVLFNKNWWINRPAVVRRFLQLYAGHLLEPRSNRSSESSLPMQLHTYPHHIGLIPCNLGVNKAGYPLIHHLLYWSVSLHDQTARNMPDSRRMKQINRETVLSDDATPDRIWAPPTLCNFEQQMNR